MSKKSADIGIPIRWLLAFMLPVALQNFFADTFYGINVHFLNHGILLAGLLDLSRRGTGKPVLAMFIVLVTGVDWIASVSLVGTAPLPALLKALTLSLQALLGLGLLQRAGVAFEPPDTQRRVVEFFWSAALVPAFISAAVLVLASGLLQDGFHAERMGSGFLWWFLSGFTSVFLVTPVILLGLHEYPAWRISGFRFPSRDFWWLGASALLCAFLIFSVANPAGRALAVYGYLLLPVMLIPAIRLPLFQSLLIMLAVSLVCFWADSESSHHPDQARRSFLALSVFLMINAGIVWIVGALLKERARAFAKEQGQRVLYEMLSRVNQTIVKYNLNREALFERVCQIVLEESDFRKVSVVSNLEAGPCFTEVVACAEGERAGGGIAAECELVNAVMRKQRVVYFNSCGTCPRYTDCGFAPSVAGSMAAFPIHQRRTITAVLAVFGGRTDAFEGEHLRLFQEMADDMGFALEMYDQKQQLKQVAEVFHHSRESIIIADTKGRILNVNPSFTRITGYTADEVVGKNPSILKSGRQDEPFYDALFKELDSEGYWSGQFWNRRKNGDLYLQRGTISAVLDEHDQPAHFIAVMEDVSAQVAAEERIHTLANFDQLTGLPNRTLLEDRFNQACRYSRRTGTGLCLMFIDLDDFKQVNDALGHKMGDSLLREVSNRFKKYVRETDTLCRFGGDEFILLMQGSVNEAANLATRLINEVNRAFELHGESIQVGASIGVSVLIQDGDALDELIQAADTAMYQAKSEGRGCFRFFAKKMQNRVQSRLALKQAIKKALAEDQFSLFYQPRTAESAGGNFETVGYEALVRWNHPVKGLVMPGSFIPPAEESGQIAEIDRWVLAHVIEQLKIWSGDPSHAVLPVAINVSASLFSKIGFVDELRELLVESGVPARLVELEITEHVATNHIEKTLATLRDLKDLGVGLAIDDFGTGYSSLSYLQQFPIDYLKIDMSFVRGVHLDTRKQGLAKAILTMAGSLGLKTIAEGVEVSEELAFLSDNGCDEFQGFYFGKPVPASDIALLKFHTS